jgi:capsular exopolysaccharide synthesis family protein
LILAIIVVFVGAAFAYNSNVTPIYEARARLVIEQSTPQVVTFRPVEAEDLRGIEYFLTQLEILRSRALAGEALAKLGMLSKLPDQQRGQIGVLVGGLTVAPVNQSRIVELRMRSPNPQFAARAVNALAEAYVEHNLKARVNASREASEWLTKQLADLRQQVDTSQGALQQYREQTEDAIALEDRRNIVAQKLEQLNTAVTSARTRRVEQETLLSQLQAIEASGAPLDTFSPIVSNTFIQGLKADLAVLQRDRAQLAEQLGDLHPDMIKVDTAIAAAEQRLNAEIAKVVEGIRQNFRAAQANERGLLAALNEQKKEVVALNRDAIGYGALQRDAASTQQIFESTLQRVKEADLAGELRANNVRILDRAEVPRGPVWPRTMLNLALAFMSASVLGVGLALGLHYFRPRLTTPDEVAESLGLPVLGIAPKMTGFKSGIGGARDEAFPPALQEAFRSIRSTLLLSPDTAGIRTLVVTCSGIGEGKTFVAANLAISMSLVGRRVLLVDGDLRRSRVHKVFGVPNSPGLSDLVAGSVAPKAAICHSAINGLSILPAGVYRGSASDLLEAAHLHNLIEDLASEFDLVVIDSPPVMAVTDAAIFANAASAVLFVVGAGVSHHVARAALQRLNAAQARIVGAVFNKADLGRRASQYESYLSDDDVQHSRPRQPLAP